MSTDTAQTAPQYDKKNPFLAKITENRMLSKEGSAKETRHFIVNIEGSGLDYIPGQSIGIFPQNPPALVTELLEIKGWNPDHQIEQKDGSSKALKDVLSSDVTLNRANAKFLKGLLEKLADGDQRTQLEAVIGDREKLEAYLFDRDYVDILKEFPEVSLTPEEFVSFPAKLVPRLYSIASSIEKHPNEVHLTVAIIRYDTHGRKKKGLATGFLADGTELGESNIPVFFALNKHFKLPEDPETPVIMVGPGTGIAPFRAFLEQREIDKASGKNWLFFGEQKQATDFLYEEEFDQWEEQGLLTRLDTAFSRDQEHKIYVQDRMREHGADLWKWIQDGAYFYVCGDAKRMAKDVHQALIDIATEHGGLSPEDADTYVNKKLIREERRYLRDVY
ncbi:MAG: sulfite reductase subunit alpha [Verrucomicrobiota bacterium]